MKTLTTCIIALLTFSSYASNNVGGTSENQVKLGLAAGWSSGPYRDYSNKVIPFPLISYEGSLLYLRGTEAGFKLYSSETDEFVMSVSVLPLFFKPEDAKTQALKSLNERKISAMAGIGWRHKAAWGVTSLAAQQRVSGNKEGAILKASYGYPFHFGKSTFNVYAGVDYNTDEMNKNYFGVSSAESEKNGLKRYRPGSGYMTYIGLLASYPLTQSLEFSAGARVTRLSDTVYDSPMVDNHYMHSFVAYVSYSF